MNLAPAVASRMKRHLQRQVDRRHDEDRDQRHRQAEQQRQPLDGLDRVAPGRGEPVGGVGRLVEGHRELVADERRLAEPAAGVAELLGHRRRRGVGLPGRAASCSCRRGRPSRSRPRAPATRRTAGRRPPAACGGRGVSAKSFMTPPCQPGSALGGRRLAAAHATCGRRRPRSCASCRRRAGSRRGPRPSCGERYASPEALTASIAASVGSSPAVSRKTTSDSDGSVTISKRSSAATRSATCSASATPLRTCARSPSSP